MANTARRYEGRCLCGDIRFVANGEPKGVYWCHCESCRRHSGAPVSVFVVFDRDAYTVTKGAITKLDTTPGQTRRGFCGRCGSTLTCESPPDSNETHFHIGAFDDAAQLQPSAKEYFPEERLPWFHASKG
ncbi:MAG TPA: GFA family protein [Candidatus Binataceae bacterium]|nr:GFA family protein [Candidatus Binataceae bacterium]